MELWDLPRDGVEVYLRVGHCSLPAAVLGELCLVSLERLTAGIPLGLQEGKRIEQRAGFMSQSGRLEECLSRLK